MVAVYSIDDSRPVGFYNTVAASQTTQKLSSVQGGTTGNTGDWLDSFTVIAGSTTPGAVTVFDGATAVYTIPAGTATVLPYVLNVLVRAFSKTGSWNVTTGAAVSVVASGRFT